MAAVLMMFCLILGAVLGLSRSGISQVWAAGDSRGRINNES